MRKLSGLTSKIRHATGSRASVALVVLLSLNATVLGVSSLDNYTRTHPEFCGTCHVMQRYVESYLTGNFMDNIHKQADVGCRDCHTDYTLTHRAEIVSRYVTGIYQPALERRTFDQAMCTRCHISMAYHADRTDYLVRNPHLSHWPDLACGDCHLAHAAQIDYCRYCHDNGGQRLTGGPIAPRADNPWARADFSDTAP